MNNRYEIAREFVEAISSDNIVQTILFGSVARGDDTNESDIDILIIIRSDNRQVEEDQKKFAQLEKDISKESLNK